MKDLKTAEEYFHRAIRQFPLYIDAYYNLGFLYNRQGRFPEAVAMLQKAVDFDPEDTGCRFELAGAYKGMKDYDKAKAELHHILAYGTTLSSAEREIISQELARMR